MYSTLDDLLKIVSEQTLIELTDERLSEEIDDSIVQSAIEDADTIIDGYLGGRYTLPLGSVPKLIKKISVDIVIYTLYSRRLITDMPESITIRYKNATKLLEKIQTGKIMLGIETTHIPEGGKYVSNKTSEDRIFNKDLLDRF